MLNDFNIELVEQPGNPPCFNVPNLTIWQTIQLGAEKMNGNDRQREPELVRTVKKAWAALPAKIFTGFEMRMVVATEGPGERGLV